MKFHPSVLTSKQSEENFGTLHLVAYEKRTMTYLVWHMTHDLSPSNEASEVSWLLSWLLRPWWIGYQPLPPCLTSNELPNIFEKRSAWKWHYCRQDSSCLSVQRLTRYFWSLQIWPWSAAATIREYWPNLPTQDALCWWRVTIGWVCQYCGRVLNAVSPFWRINESQLGVLDFPALADWCVAPRRDQHRTHFRSVEASQVHNEENKIHERYKYKLVYCSFSI